MWRLNRPDGSRNSALLLDLCGDLCCRGNLRLLLTCLKLCLYSLQAVSTVNLVLKMLQSLAP